MFIFTSRAQTHRPIDHPIRALLSFLEVYSELDWKTHGVTAVSVELLASIPTSVGVLTSNISSLSYSSSSPYLAQMKNQHQPYYPTPNVYNSPDRDSNIHSSNIQSYNSDVGNSRLKHDLEFIIGKYHRRYHKAFTQVDSENTSTSVSAVPNSYAQKDRTVSFDNRDYLSSFPKPSFSTPENINHQSFNLNSASTFINSSDTSSNTISESYSGFIFVFDPVVTTRNLCATAASATLTSDQLKKTFRSGLRDLKATIDPLIQMHSSLSHDDELRVQRNGNAAERLFPILCDELKFKKEAEVELNLHSSKRSNNTTRNNSMDYKESFQGLFGAPFNALPQSRTTAPLTPPNVNSAESSISPLFEIDKIIQHAEIVSSFKVKLHIMVHFLLFYSCPF
jgi:hypothetical protein